MADWRSNVRRLLAGKTHKDGDPWTQGDLATAAGLRPNTLSEALTKRSPKVVTAEKIAKGLGVPTWALFCDEREYALFSEKLEQADAVQRDARRRDDVRAAVQDELAPIVESIVQRLAGTPPRAVAPPARPVPVPRPAKRRKA